MKKRFSFLTLIVVALVVAIVAGLIGFSGAYKLVKGQQMRSALTDGSMEMLAALDYAYRSYYYGEIDETALEQGLIEGYIYGVGDKYGEYMDAERMAEFTEDNNGSNVGIGVSVVYNDDYGMLEVVNVVADSPAEASGVLIGDLIAAVGDTDAAELGYYGALDAMVGEEGTTAEFTVLRDGEYVEFSIVRAKVIQENALGRMFEDGITGIIRIEEFDAATPSQFKSEITRLQSEGAERFVFDVRNNPGGDLESIIEILDYLLPEGPIIRIESKDGNLEERSSDAECVDFDMAVLVNENTASAAELFAAALKDYDKATLVGKTTYGKGSMQSIIPLINGSALRITVNMYHPPFSDNYDGVGVVPHEDCDMAEEVKDVSIYKLTDSTDTQLIKAVEILNNNS